LDITAAVVPSSITQGYSFSWVSGDTDCVEVTSSGLYNVTGTVRAKDIGTTKITVTLSRAVGSSIVKDITVTVGWPGFDITGPTDIENGTDTLYRITSSSGTLSSDYSVEWSCLSTSDGGEADIDITTGVLTPTDPGTVVITAKLYYKNDGPKVTKTLSVTITDPVSG